MPVESEWLAPDGARIWTRRWDAATPKAAVVLIHGLGEHTGRYDHFGDCLAGLGYTVSAFDLRGHGRSSGKRGHIASYELVLDDIQARLDDARALRPGLPVFLYGHSLGGNLALTYVLTRNPDLAGVIASSPGLAPGTPVNPVKLALGSVLYRLAPTVTLPNGLPLDGLSRDPTVLERALADPLYHDKVSARLGLDLIRAGERIRAWRGAVRLPLLLVQGTADRVVDAQATPRLAASLTGDVTLKMWEGLYHELHNEAEWKTVLEYAAAWMDARLPGGRR